MTKNRQEREPRETSPSPMVISDFQMDCPKEKKGKRERASEKKSARSVRRWRENEGFFVLLGRVKNRAR